MIAFSGCQDAENRARVLAQVCPKWQLIAFSGCQDAGNRARVLAQLCPKGQLCGPLLVSFYQSRYSFKGIVAQEGHVTLLPRWGRRWINLIFGFLSPPRLSIVCYGRT